MYMIWEHLLQNIYRVQQRGKVYKMHHMHKLPSLVWPDPFHTAAYQLEIKSAMLQESGTVLKVLLSPVVGEC